MKRRDVLEMCGAWLSSEILLSLFPLNAIPSAKAGASRGEGISGKSIVQREEPDVPGEVIFHIPKRRGRYVGSPGIVILPDGSYLAKCDLFGPLSNEYIKPFSLVFSSRDMGRSWELISKVKGLFWASIFYLQEKVYMIGTSRCMGYTVIMASRDNGRTWSVPEDDRSGLLIKDWSHTAPVPVVVHNGRIWRAMERTNGPFPWNRQFSAFMMSAPVDANLLRADTWTFSNRVPFKREWLKGKSLGLCDWPDMWLEGNAVVTPGGEMVDILRIDKCGMEELAAVVRISADGKSAEFDPEKDLISFPGGAKKFTIRFDPASGRYWSLVNLVLDEYKDAKTPYKIRNTQALVSSTDLRNWSVMKIILHHPDVKKHGFQYLDWLFEDDDIIAVSRTAYEDGMGGASDFHDANFLTFHRIHGFRKTR
jgi:hypothetical protein